MVQTEAVSVNARTVYQCNYMITETMHFDTDNFTVHCVLFYNYITILYLELEDSLQGGPAWCNYAP